ncbi:MAG: hypothetical protein ABW033_02640 [Acidimicrobiia bacterium]
MPGAGSIFFEGVMAQLSPKTVVKVDYHRTDRAPMLFVGFGKDHVVPTSVSKGIAAKYEKRSTHSPSTTSTRTARTSPASTAGKQCRPHP